MKSLTICIAVLILTTPTVFARHISRQHSHHRHHHHSTTTRSTREGMVAKQASYYGEVRRTPGGGQQYLPHETVEVAGSSLPNCSRACGSCSPCRLVTVTFVCASLQEAETCPMAYRCMCRNKSFPVP